MSMLAGPRRKQKVINLRAKNNAWSNDSSKFGQRMLEKMGWSSGKGLGANENGIVEHVVARYKNDDRGLGFEDKNDQWTKHEDEFDTLLAKLSNVEKAEEKAPSGVSLEVKSKTSKTRIHYHKFTRGKDLSRYSEKDLANIFGKKSFKNEDNDHTEVLNDVIKTTEQVFTEKGSMEDYFKSKLKALKGKNSSIPCENNEINRDEDLDYGFKGFSGGMDNNTLEKFNNDSEIQPFSFYSDSTNQRESEIFNSNNGTEEIKKKKKKKKYSEFDTNQDSNEFTQEITKKKKKGLDNEINEQSELDRQEINDQNVAVTNEIKKEKTSKKKKLKDLAQVKTEEGESLPQKKKNKDITVDTLDVLDPAAEETNTPKKKKKRKNKDKE